MKTFKLSYEKDPVSDKDLIFSSLKDKLVKTGELSFDEFELPEHTPISDQGNIGSCTANATIDALEILLGLKSKDSVVQLSRLFTYYNSRVYIGKPDKDSGGHLRNVFDSLKRFGVCLESSWDYDVSKVFIQPPIYAYQEAIDNKIDSYYRIDSYDDGRVRDVITALRNNYPIVFVTSISDTFAKNWGAEVVFSPPKDSIGNHAMILTGYKKVNGNYQFKVRNSWGNLWGKNGHCWITDDYLNHYTTSDLWVPTLAPILIYDN
jgi:C1A family cysteine protease